MQLNIKDRETHELVTRLAAATGQSRSRVVKDAVRARLTEVESAREADIAARIARALDLAAQIRAKMPIPLPKREELDAWMYDEDGSPR